MAYTIVVAASASESAAMQYIAPYAGCTMGEYFRDRGQDALIIYDDLTKQAWAYRQVSLLLRRPPGREAYAGEVVYLHSRLLVRRAVAQYTELAAFAQFARDLDEATRKHLERGRMVTELMKQLQYQPLQVWEMALTLFAVNNGYFDDGDVKKALAAEKSMRDYVKGKYAELVGRMEEKKDLSAEDEKSLHDAIKDWKKNGSF